jgi:hypothetical protein
MPDRIVRAGILTSDAVCSLNWAAEVFYRRLMSVADDYGRFDGRPSVLRASLYALQLDKVTEPDIGKWIRETVEAGLVRDYAVEGKPFVEIVKFDQRLRAKKSKWPHPLSDVSRCCQTLTNATEASTETESNTEARAPALVGNGDDGPVVPTVEEVITFGASGSGIPEDYCRHYHAKRTEANAWVRNGQLIRWQLEAKRWWEGDREQWLAKRKSAPKSTAQGHWNSKAEADRRVREAIG